MPIRTSTSRRPRRSDYFTEGPIRESERVSVDSLRKVHRLGWIDGITVAYFELRKDDRAWLDVSHDELYETTKDVQKRALNRGLVATEYDNVLDVSRAVERKLPSFGRARLIGHLTDTNADFAWDDRRNVGRLGALEDVDLSSLRFAFFTCARGHVFTERMCVASHRIISPSAADATTLTACTRCRAEHDNLIRRRCAVRSRAKTLTVARLHPKLDRTWSPLNDESPDQVPANTKSRFLFTHPKCGHHTSFVPLTLAIYYAERSGWMPCGVCTNRDFQAGVNDLATLYPAKYAQLVPGRNKNADRFPSRGSTPATYRCTKCRKEATEEVRVFIKNDMCPSCRKWISKPERALFEALSTRFSNSVSNPSLSVAWGKSRFARPDFVGERSGMKVVVEYDGEYFHGPKFPGSERKDLNKTSALLLAGYLVYRVRENALKQLTLSHAGFGQVNFPADGDYELLADQIGLWVDQIAVSSGSLAA